MTELVVRTELEPAGKLTEVAMPHALAVARELDVVVVKDLVEDAATGETSTVYALGRNEDRASGLRGFEVTPHFESMETLERFCDRHRKEFYAAAEAERFPDKWFWEATHASS